MKFFITTLVIALTLSITLLAVVSVSSYFSRKTMLYRSAALSQNQPGSEILGGSYSEMLNVLFASSGR